MVQRCCIKNCKERQKHGANVSFHQFPKNPELKKQWVKAIKCDNFEPSSHSRVCSKHFASDCFVGSPWSSKRILSVTAIPNVSYVCKTQHMQETDIINVPGIETENETASLKTEIEEDSLRHTVGTVEENASLEKPLKKKRKVYVGDFEECDVINEKGNYAQIINTTIAKKNNQVKTLQQKNRRLTRKIEDLRSLVADLRNRHMITEDVSIKLLTLG